MYDLSGLYYEMIINGLIFGIVGLEFLFFSKFWMDEKNIKDLMLGLFLIVLCISFLCYHSYVISDLEISVYEGIFIDENRENPYLFRMEYCFGDKGKEKTLLYLDIFSKKKLYSDEFEKDVMYKIYYEEKTDVIVKIEKLE